MLNTTCSRETHEKLSTFPKIGTTGEKHARYMKFPQINKKNAMAATTDRQEYKSVQETEKHQCQVHLKVINLRKRENITIAMNFIYASEV